MTFYSTSDPLALRFPFISLLGLGTGAPIIESPYGDPVNPEDAPESISRAVASLPPEQMFELMKQMKVGGPASQRSWRRGGLLDCLVSCRRGRILS